MKSTIWKYGLGALLVGVGMSACTPQTTGREEAQAPYTAPEATTTAPMGTGTAQTDPYGTTQPETMTGRTDIGDTGTGTDTMGGRMDGTMGGRMDGTMGGGVDGTQGTRATTGDTLGDRCAGFTGEALTECLEMEATRRQDLQDPTQMPPQDVPRQ